MVTFPSLAEQLEGILILAILGASLGQNQQ
jgi:hypothetical protein